MLATFPAENVGSCLSAATKAISPGLHTQFHTHGKLEKSQWLVLLLHPQALYGIHTDQQRPHFFPVVLQLLFSVHEFHKNSEMNAKH